MRQLAAFVVVGTIGFIVDAGIVTALVRGGMTDAFWGRGASFPIAVLVTWSLNRRFSFSSNARSARDVASEYGRYFSVQLLGFAANLVVYWCCLLIWPELQAWPALPVAAGSAIGLAINFLGSRFWVFRSRTSS